MLVKINDQPYLLEGSDQDKAVPKDKTPEKVPSFKNETREILGYTCKKLVNKMDGQYQTLWYTTELPVIGSALGIITEQGLVLAMESKELSFIAISISLEKIADSLVMPPKDVPVINHEEYVKKGGSSFSLY